MKFRIPITVILCALLMILAQWGYAQPEDNSALLKFKADQPAIKIKWNEKSELPMMMTNINAKGATRPKNEADVERICMTFLAENQELLKVPAENVKVKNVWQFQKKWYVTFQTFYKQIPIYRGQVGFTVDEKGNILSYKSDYDPKMEVDVEPAISKEEAIKIANKNHRPKVKMPVKAEAYLMIYQERDKNEAGKYILAWNIFLASGANHSDVDRVFFIDARSGKIIKDFYPNPNAITGTIQGDIYPLRSTDAVTAVAFEHAEVSVPATSDDTDAAGAFTLNTGAGNHVVTTTLEGPFVKVQTYDAATGIDQDIVHTANVNNGGVLNFTWTAANCAPDDGDGLNTFWHANHLHDDYYQAILGINWNNPFTGTSQMLYSVNRSNINNAFAGSPVTIHSNTIARSCDIVYHETTHNILYGIFGGSWVGWPADHTEGYAFDEGFGDYVACSFNNDANFGENAGIGVRSCDNAMKYPGVGYNIEGHTGGQLISGVAWDLWSKQGLNHNAADVLLFAGLSEMATQPGPYYFSNPNQSNYLESLLTSDDNNNNVADGTPNDRQIFQAFRNHDMLPVDVFCKDSPEDDGNVPSAGHHWTSSDIWVRNNQDGGMEHQNPIFGQMNYIYVRVRNLGYLPADATTVNVYWADPASGIPWPADWNLIGSSVVNNLAEDSEVIAAAISWTPALNAIGHRCLLVRLECADDMMTEEGNAKNENNIAQKNVTIISLPPGSSAGRPVEAKFYIRNYKSKKIDLMIDMKKVKHRFDYIKSTDSAIPIKVEIEVPKLTNYDKLSGLTAASGIRTPKFVLQKNKGIIPGLRISEKKMMTIVRLYPSKNLKAGETYELNIAQRVDGEIVGGMTYTIKIKK